MTRFQRELLGILGRSRTPDSYLAGGAALHFQPNTRRYSRDLDFFHDSEERVATAFAEDRESLLEHLKRRGRFRPEEVARLDLARPFDLVAAKERWLEMLDVAEGFARSRPADEVGCLYFSPAEERFVLPEPGDLEPQDISPHFGRPGGVLPQASG